MKFKKLKISIGGSDLYCEDGQPHEYLENWLRKAKEKMEKKDELGDFKTLFGIND